MQRQVIFHALFYSDILMYIILYMTIYIYIVMLKIYQENNFSSTNSYWLDIAPQLQGNLINLSSIM